MELIEWLRLTPSGPVPPKPAAFRFFDVVLSGSIWYATLPHGNNDEVPLCPAPVGVVLLPLDGLELGAGRFIGPEF